MRRCDSRGRRLRVDAVFAGALDLPASERARFLDRACVGDRELRREVEELLRHADHPLAALEPGVLAEGGWWSSLLGATPADAGRPSVMEGSLLGKWRIVREIGRGGMGTVYLVVRADGQFEQRAALKLIPLGDDSTMSVRRFARERQILASLTHPNIARLLDGGQGPDGQPYLVMELVEGRPIDRYSDDERLGLDERLALFEQVCRAVEHAHRNLVIHRDLKPSNIVVTDGGDVKLLDFGIATVIALGEGSRAATRPTRVRALTPEYASPEQIAGEGVGTASDVYQLGLLLSELLTGEPVRRPPTAGGSPLLALERWVEAPPPRPSSRAAEATREAAAARRTSAMALARRLRGDLDAIVLYALRREPERRYAGVAEMREDIERHRTGRPVRARPDSLGYRTSRFVKRYHRLLAASVAVLAVGGWGYHSWSQERLQVAREAERTYQIESILGELFSLPNPRRGARPPEARDLVDHANLLVSRELGENPASQARLLTVLGRVYNALGLYEPSLAALERAAALAREAFPPGSEEEKEALRWMAQSQHYSGDLLAAERTLLRVLGDAADDELERPEVLDATLELADLQHSLGRLVAAETTLHRALAALERRGRADEPRARALRDLGNVLRDRGAWSEAEAAYREALRILRSLPGPVDQQVASVEIYLARLLIVEGRWEEAESLLARGSATLRRVYGSEHPLTGTAFRNLAFLRIEQGRFAEAEEHLRRAQEVFHRFLGPVHPMVARARVHEAELALRRGRYTEAVTLAESAISLLRTLGIGEHPSSLDACRTLAEALVRLGEPDRASELLRPCARTGERLFVPGDPRLSRDRELLRRIAAAAEHGRQGS